MTAPKVSVIIPVYNVEPYLRQCLDSVTGQTLGDIEIICVDDGSTDGSPAILAEYAAADPRIRVLTQANAGAGAARNRGMACAGGEYLSHLDSDDFFEPDMLEKAYLRAEATAADIVLYGSDRYWDSTGMFEPAPWTVRWSEMPAKDCFASSEIRGNMYLSTIGWAWDKLLRRSFIEENGLIFQEIQLHDDLFFVYAAFSVCKRVSLVNEVMAHQRKRGGGSLTDGSVAWWCMFEALDELRSFLIDRGLYKTLGQDFDNYALHMTVYMMGVLKTRPDSLAAMRAVARDRVIPCFGLAGHDSRYYRNQREYAVLRLLLSGTADAAGAQSAPKVSVIIPVYNVEPYLRQCLDSVAGQTLGDIEIICVDDGSTDGSPAILAEYAAADPRFAVITQPNAGPGAARNAGLDRATGEYVSFIDADDHIETAAYETLYKKAASKKADILVFGGDCGPANTWERGRLTSRRAHYISKPYKALFGEPSSRPFSTNKLYMRKMLCDNGVRFRDNMRLGEDQLFVFEVFPCAGRIFFIPDALYHYRLGRAGSLMRLSSADLDDKIYKHIELCDSIYRSWQASGYMAGHEAEWADWCIGFLWGGISGAGFTAVADAARAMERWFVSDAYTAAFSKQARRMLEDSRACIAAVDAPRVSVIMPVYNAEAYLEQCLDSLQEQTMRAFELICVDDGSTDGSLPILQKYAAADPRFRILTQKNCGAGAARNAGIDSARGKYLLFLDSDDFFEPRLLERLCEKAGMFNADISVCAARSYDDLTGAVVDMRWTCNTNKTPADKVFSGKTEPRHIYSFTTPAPWNKLFSREFVKREGLYFQNTRSANDVFFVITALSSAERIVCFGEYLVNYRVNTDTSLQATQHKAPLSFFEALLACKCELERRGIYPRLEQAFATFALDCCIYNLGVMKTDEAFREVYSLLKERAFAEFGITGHARNHFNDYDPANYDKYTDVMSMGADAYMAKYNLKLPKAAEADGGEEAGAAADAEIALLKKRLSALRRECEANRKNARELSLQLKNIRGSRSYKIYTRIMYLPRKLYGGVRCCREHGLAYTVRLGFAKVGRVLRRAGRGNG